MHDALWFHNRACEQRAAGDLVGALATLDEGLVAVGLEDGAGDEVAFLLHTKAVTLGLTGEADEAQALFNRALELTDGREDEGRVRLLQAHCRIGMALLPAERGDHADAESALMDIALRYGADMDPDVRCVAVSALGLRGGELLKLRDFDEARSNWELLHHLYGAEPDPAARAEVALAGKEAAVGLFRAGRTRAGLATANEVISLYRTESEPDIRAAVAITMLARLISLWRRARLLAAWRRSKELVRFLRERPEREVVQAMCSASSYGEALVRRALGLKKRG